MTIITSQVELTDTATKVVDGDNMGQVVHFHNMSKSSNQYIHIGNENLTNTNSIHLDPGESLTLTVRPLDEIYALSEPTGITLGILINRKRD